MSANRTQSPKPQPDRHTLAPFPLRLPPKVRAAAELKAAAEERSLNWTITDLVAKALGLKEPTP